MFYSIYSVFYMLELCKFLKKTFLVKSLVLLYTMKRLYFYIVIYAFISSLVFTADIGDFPGFSKMICFISWNKILSKQLAKKYKYIL